MYSNRNAESEACLLVPSVSQLGAAPSVEGLWNTVVEHAELQVAAYLASKKCESFDPLTSDLAESMLHFIDRSTLSNILKERNYDGLCGRFGCLLKPRMYQRAENTMDFTNSSTCESSDEDDGCPVEPNVAAGKSEPNHSTDHVGEEDELVYADDYYTRESFRLAMRDQERWRRLRSYHQQRKGPSQGVKVADRPPSVNPGAEDGATVSAKGSISTVNAASNLPCSLIPSPFPTIGGASAATTITSSITFMERFCSDECMKVFEMDIKARVTRQHVDYAHPEMVNAMGKLFPNLHLDVLLQLSQEKQKIRQKGRSSTMDKKMGENHAVESVLGEIQEKRITSTASIDSSQMGSDARESSGADNVRKELLQSFLSTMKEMRYAWKEDGSVQLRRNYLWDSPSITSPSSTTAGVASNRTAESTEDKNRCSSSASPCPAAHSVAPSHPPSASLVETKTLSTPHPLTVRSTTTEDNTKEKACFLSCEGGCPAPCDGREVGLQLCRKENYVSSSPPFSCFAPFSTDLSVVAVPSSQDVRTLKEAVMKNGAFLVHDFLVDICGVRCGHWLLAHYAAHRTALKDLWEKRRNAGHYFPSSLKSSECEALSACSTHKSTFEKVITPIFQQLEATLQKMPPQLNVTEPLRVDSSLEHQRRQQLAQHLFSMESTSSLSRFLLMDESVVATVAWNGVWLTPPPSSNTSATKTRTGLPSTFSSLMFPFPVSSSLLKPLSSSSESLEIALLFLLASACVHPGVLNEFLFRDARLEDVVDVLDLSDDDLEAALRVMFFSYE